MFLKSINFVYNSENNLTKSCYYRNADFEILVLRRLIGHYFSDGQFSPYVLIQRKNVQFESRQIHCVFQCFLHSRRFASDGLLRPQDGSKMAQEGPKRCPGGPQDRPKSAQDRPKSGPRGSQEAHVRVPTGGMELRYPPFFDRWALKASKRAPRKPQEGPKRAPGGARKPPRWP